MNHRKPAPLVSIIIPTYNSQRTIRQCLQSVKNQTYKNIETIIVDRYSVDETRQIALQFKAKVLSLNSERSAARNHGVRNAKGEFVLFIDSDMDLGDQVVDECVKLCVGKNLDAVAIPEITVANGFLAKCRSIERELYDNTPNFFVMPRFFRKEAFLNVHGFDEKLVSGEDFDLARRYEKQGHPIGMATSHVKHHEGKLLLKSIVLKAHYYGKSFTSFFSKAPTLVLRGYCPTRFAWNIRRLLEQPVCLGGLAIIKTFEYMAYLTGIVAGAFERTPLTGDRA